MVIYVEVHLTVVRAVHYETVFSLKHLSIINAPKVSSEKEKVHWEILKL